MQDGRPNTKSRGWKSLKLSHNLSLTFICYINLYVIATLVGLAVSYDLSHGLDQNFVNPGIGVNYYGKIQNTTIQTFANGLHLENIFHDFVPRNCSQAPEGTRCVQRTFFYSSPALINQFFNQVPCNFSEPYRHYNGTCLNPHVTPLGIAGDCFFRFGPPYYDGYGGFRKTVTGKPLPEPRDISLKIFKDLHKPESNISFQFLSFGQFVGHDMSRAVQLQTDCCSPANAYRDECTPIPVRSDDPFYSQFNRTCIDFQRTEMCKFGKHKNREQQNGATAALDVSVLYGVSENELEKLRALDGTGMLKTSGSSQYCLLPTGKDPQDPFCPKSQESECFVAGDARVNQHASLTSMHTIWMREHNRIATELKKLNPQWIEEKLFQETRKFLIAEYQSIIYQEFLPILLSPRIIEEFEMSIEKGSNGSLFSPHVVIAVWHDFAHAAFRLHSMVPSNIGLPDLPLKDTFSNPHLIRQGLLTDMIKGSQLVPTEKFDRYLIKDLSDFLYKDPLVPYGKDLAATNIQRGRDHGIAPYFEIVKFCTERTVNIASFDDLVEFGIMPAENVELLKELYESVEDIDMWVGMQLENRMPGSVLGPSAVCVCAKQFYFSQKGDRLFFNHEGEYAPFTADQRSAIKYSSIARILCDNTDIKQVSKNPFLLPSTENPQVDCEDIPNIDLSFWQENQL